MNKFEQRSKSSYDKKAENYDATFDGKFTLKFKEMLYQEVEVKRGDNVADIACGNGQFLYNLSKKNDFCGFGVDLSEKMIEQAKILNPDMKFSVASCEELPFDKEQIDIMTVSAAYHHFPHVEKFAKEASRVIKKDGLIYIAEVYMPAIFRVICNPFLKFSKAGDVKFYAPEEIISLFENNGFIRKKKVINGKVQVVIMRNR